MPSKEQMDLESPVSSVASEICCAVRMVVRRARQHQLSGRQWIIRCADFDAKRTYYRALSVSLPGGKGGCIVQKIDDLAALATAS